MILQSEIHPVEEKYVNDFDVYLLYQAFRLHYNTNYDAVKYNFANKTINWDSYKKVSIAEVNMYQKYANEFQTKENVLIALAAHFHYNNPIYPLQYSPKDDDLQEAYVKLKQFLYSPKHFITHDLTYINHHGTIDVIRTLKGNIPKIYPMATKGLIRIESLLVIDHVLNLTKYISTKIDSFTWTAFKENYIKYSPFVVTSVDDSLVQLIKNSFKELKQKT